MAQVFVRCKLQIFKQPPPPPCPHSGAKNATVHDNFTNSNINPYKLTAIIKNPLGYVSTLYTHYLWELTGWGMSLKEAGFYNKYSLDLS